MWRPDIDRAISFLWNRVTKITKEDKEKSRQVVQYLKKKNDKRIMVADSLIQLYTWFDAAYGLHTDLKIHTGGCMSFGYGMVYCKSSKHKLNTKSSNDDKLIGLRDYLPYNICICLFMVSQGYDIKHNILFHDSQSAINMEKNVKN